jgi:hypothetical protein
MLLGLSFEERVGPHPTEKAELPARLTTAPPKPAPAVESYAEACIEIAAAVKHAIRDCGKSRSPALCNPPSRRVDRTAENHGGWIGGDVITREEKNDLLIGKIKEAVYELSRLKRQVRGRGR